MRPDDRFFSRVRMTDSCWVWVGAKRRGYAHFSVDRKSVYAHRYAYERLVGPIPTGLQLDHLCRNTICVRPDHLEPVTGRENLLRGDTIPARNATKTHCDRGHVFDEANTYLNRGRRQCRACHRENEARRRACAAA